MNVEKFIQVERNIRYIDDGENGWQERMKITLDEGFQFGLGAFETIAVEAGKPIFLDKHLKRLERAAEFLYLGTLSERGITEKQILRYLEEQAQLPESRANVANITQFSESRENFSDITLCVEDHAF